jgi:hypothetical protein
MSADARLRLAARTLIELRTPQSSEAYLDVLHDLIRRNPLIQENECNLTRRVLPYDNKGVLLWFLSETLSADKINCTKETADRVPDFLKDLISRWMMHLYDSEIILRNTIPTGTKKAFSYLAAVIVESIVGRSREDSTRTIHASAGVFAMVAPLAVDDRRAILQPALSYAHLAVVSDRRLKTFAFIGRITRLVTIASMFIILQAVVLGAVILGKDLFSLEFDDLLAIFDITFYYSSPGTIFFIVLGSILGAAVSFTITWLFSRRLQNQAHQMFIRIYKKRANLENNEPAIDVDFEPFVHHLLSWLGEYFAAHPTVWRQFLETPEEKWFDTALVSISNLTDELIKVILIILQGKEIGLMNKVRLFRWMCARVEAEM